MRGKVLLAVVMFSSPFVLGQTNAPVPGLKVALVTGTATAKSSQSVCVRIAELTGMEGSRQGELTKCRRNCELKLGSVLVKADEIDYHETGDAEARGNVRIKVLADTAAISHQP